MKVTVAERLIIPALLPEKANFLNLKLINTAKEECSFSDKEHKKYKFRNDPRTGAVMWDVKPKDEEKDIDFGEVVTKMIVDKLKELDEKEELQQFHLSLYEKFVDKE